MSYVPAPLGGTFTIGGSVEVHRLGFGAMQITGNGVWGPPEDPEGAVRVLRRAIELGIDFIDTADSYGPYVSEDLIRIALHPYATGLKIATKAGLVRTGPGVWLPVGRPEYLRQEVEMSLRRLAVERIDLMQLHRIDPKVPLEEQIGVFADLQREGKIDRFGLSEVTVEQIQAAEGIMTIDSVQNLYNISNRSAEPVLEYCESKGIAFIPWFPIQTGSLARNRGVVGEIATETGATPAQIALAWLLMRSPVIVPIPGTKSVDHLEENAAAGTVSLTDVQFKRLHEAARS
jgi:aryl-alcohol dehydrogenase-like predicted oxidoreductase